MAGDLTLTYYLTDTLTPIVGASVAIWNAADSSVVDSGVTDASGQITSAALADASYTARAFLTDYTISDSAFTIAGVNLAVTAYGDAVDTNANTFAFYRTTMINKSGGRNDTRSLAIFMSAFNEAQEYLSNLIQWEDLMISTTSTFTADDGEYSLSDLSITNLNEVIAIRVNDGTDWKEPMEYVSPLDWDIFISTDTAPATTPTNQLPEYYTKRNKKLLFHPLPYSTYSFNIVGTAYATPVTSTSSVVSLTNIDSVLLARAMYYAWEDLHEAALSDKALKKYNDLIVPYLQRAIRTRYASSQYLRAPRATLSK